MTSYTPTGKQTDEHHIVGAPDHTGGGVFCAWMVLSLSASRCREDHECIDSTGISHIHWCGRVLAAIGLTLPGITRILPRFIPWAAAGLMIVMTGATVLHLARREYGSAATTAVLLAVLTFVAYMRWKVTPISPRTKAA